MITQFPHDPRSKYADVYKDDVGKAYVFRTQGMKTPNRREGIKNLYKEHVKGAAKRQSAACRHHGRRARTKNNDAIVKGNIHDERSGLARRTRRQVATLCRHHESVQEVEASVTEGA